MKLIQARIDGVWDDPALLEFGCLSPDTEEDIKRIIEYCATKDSSCATLKGDTLPEEEN